MFLRWDPQSAVEQFHDKTISNQPVQIPQDLFLFGRRHWNVGRRGTGCRCHSFRSWYGLRRGKSSRFRRGSNRAGFGRRCYGGFCRWSQSGQQFFPRHPLVCAKEQYNLLDVFRQYLTDLETFETNPRDISDTFAVFEEVEIILTQLRLETGGGLQWEPPLSFPSLADGLVNAVVRDPTARGAADLEFRRRGDELIKVIGEDVFFDFLARGKSRCCYRFRHRRRW